MPYSTYPPEDEENFESDEESPRRIRKNSHRPRHIKYEFNVPENYKDFQQLGIPADVEERFTNFLRQNNIPSHEVIAHYEAKGNAIAGWLNRQVYDLERLCLRTGALTENFQKLEEFEVLTTQLKHTTTAVKTLQSKLDDQLFPWLTKSNVKKYGPTLLAFLLIIIATIIWFKSNGNNVSTPNSTPTIQSTQSTPTQEKSRAN